MTIEAGEFWVAKIPFTNGISTKKRPVLVLWCDGEDVVVAVVTSASPRSPTDVLIQDWSISGLRVPSTVRLSRLDCLEKSLLLTKIGRVSQGDAQTIKKIWSLYIRLEF
ncbi:type II toxin-antitoxin system PemK/MazF family toxin [Cyanothece sp. BG0011]|uniref:type II toxin-antitoxin system PemK/MazF family toxin n=1 Tax=Cyanothece sp. BG0011 TaxID=2082950 RepID=UPI000D1E1C7C|nr:type II toxin-antitoxin system PemK/MazF family toxin [Cyanothece sp. BG0011]